MFFFDCEAGYVPENGQNDVTDGSVEDYPPEAPAAAPPCPDCAAGDADTEMAPDAGTSEFQAP